MLTKWRVVVEELVCRHALCTFQLLFYLIRLSLSVPLLLCISSQHKEDGWEYSAVAVVVGGW